MLTRTFLFDSDMIHIDVNKCRACGGNLVFDVYTGKKHCTACGRIWEFDLDFKRNKLIVREWLCQNVDLGMELKDELKKKHGDEEVIFPDPILTVSDKYSFPFSSGSNGYITKARYNNNTIELYHDWWQYGWFPYKELEKDYPKAVKKALNNLSKLL